MFKKDFSRNYFLILFSLIIMQYIAVNEALDLPDHLRVQARKLHDRCQKQTGVAEELIRKAHDGNIPEDGTLKCYIHCLFNIIGLMDENENIHLENIKEVLPEETHGIIQNLVDACGTQKGVDGCDTAYQTVKCYFKADYNTLKAVVDFVFS